MSRHQFDASRLVKWYPPSWRERYGDEFGAYLEDELGGARPSFRFLISVAYGALRERTNATGLLGDRDGAEERLRASSLLILCAWSLFMLAGASFSKLTEHFSRSMPAGSSSLARIGFDTVAVSGALGMVLLGLGALIALPSLVRFLRSGGWAGVRGPLSLSTTLTLLTFGAVVPLAIWAHHLSAAQRNGSDGAYSGAFAFWALLVAAVLFSWDRAVIACVSKMTLSPRVLHGEAVLATALLFLMVVITGGTTLWWSQLAYHAPWFLQGTNVGSSPSPVTPNLTVTLAVMVVATGVGIFGVNRIRRSWRGLHA